MSDRLETETGSLLPRGYEWVQRGVPAMFDRETDIRAIADVLMKIDRLRRSGDVWADFAARLYDAGLRPQGTAERHECLVVGCPCGEMSADEWRRAYFVLAEIALKQQANPPIGYWCCADDWNAGQFRTGDCIGRTRGPDPEWVRIQASDSPEKP